MVRRLQLILFLGIFLFEARPGQAEENTCLTASGQEAVDLCTVAIMKFFSNKPVRVLALRKRALAHLELKSFDKAKRDIDEVISSGLTSAEDWWVRGMALAWLDQWELALKDQEKANSLVKGRADFLVELASAQVSTGRFDEGANTYSSLVSTDATNPAYYAGRGQAYYYAGDYDRALADYTSAVIHGGEDASYWFKRGLVREAMGDETNAEKDYTEAVKRQQGNAEFRNTRGRILLYLGDYDSAEYDFDQSIATDPKPDTYLNRASLHIFRNKLDLARKDIASAGENPDFDSRIRLLRGRILAAGGDFAAAVATYDGALQKDPGYVSLLYWRASANHELGKYQKAYDDYSKLFTEWPLDEVVRLDRAHALFELNRLSEAYADVAEALRLDPNFAAALEARARFLNYESQWQKAIIACSQAMGIDPDRPLAYYRRAFAKWGLGDLEGADSDYEKAITLDSKFASAHAEWAEVLAELKRFDEAHREIETAMKMEPEISGHARRLGRIYELESKSDEAAAAYQKAIALDPEDGWNYEGRAWFNISTGKWAAADDDCRLMIKKMPKEPASYRCVAHVKWAANDIPETLEALAQALRVDPKYGAAYYDRGRIMLDKADYEEAAANFSTAISLNYRLADSLVYRGDTLRNLRLESSALKDYREAAKLADRGLAPLISRRISGLKPEIPASLDDSNYPQDRRRASQ